MGGLSVPDNTPMWRSENSIQESVFSFYYLGRRDSAQFIRLGGTHLYPLGHVINPQSSIL